MPAIDLRNERQAHAALDARARFSDRVSFSRAARKAPWKPTPKFCCDGTCNQGERCCLRVTEAAAGFVDTVPTAPALLDDAGPMPKREAWQVRLIAAGLGVTVLGGLAALAW